MEVALGGTAVGTLSGLPFGTFDFAPSDCPRAAAPCRAVIHALCKIVDAVLSKMWQSIPEEQKAIAMQMDPDKYNRVNKKFGG